MYTKIIYDEYTTDIAKEYIEKVKIHSCIDKATGFKPRNIGYVDLRRPMIQRRRISYEVVL